MTQPTRDALGPTTLNRMWYLDVDTADNPTTPTWVAVMGIKEFQPARAANLEDDSDFDGGGDQSQAKTAQQWSIVFKVRRGVIAAVSPATPTYDPGQEFLREKDKSVGVANVAHIRWYEMEPGGPRIEAYDGSATVAWSPDGGADTALNIVTVTLTGRGRRNDITHPDAA